MLCESCQDEIELEPCEHCQTEIDVCWQFCAYCGGSTLATDTPGVPLAGQVAITLLLVGGLWAWLP